MRNSVIGLIVGAVLGVVLGATVIAPRLQRAVPGTPGSAQVPSQTPVDIAKQLPRALVPRPAVSLKMATSFPLDAPIAGPLARRIDSAIWEVSHGQIEIRSYPPGALASVVDLFDAVESGAIDAAFASPSLAAGKVPALEIFGGIPFGPAPDEFLAWLDFGGGGELFGSITQAHNIHAVPCGILPPSAFGWFRSELQSPQDLKGLRMDVGGLGARVLTRLGVQTVDLSPGDLMLALEQGTLDAVSYASPVIDREMHFETWLKNYYPEGWRQSLTLLALMTNLKKWEALSGSQKAQINAVCSDSVRYSLAKGEASQFQALKEMFGEGVRLLRLSPGINDALEGAWQQVVQQASNDDADFQRVWQSLSAFRAEYVVWRELGRP
jgi:TRAP-type mannitol/chloroaromatic compound transport system substrate-binding protein